MDPRQGAGGRVWRRARSSAGSTDGKGMQRAQVGEVWGLWVGGLGRKGACGARSSHERLVTSVVLLPALF